MDEYDIHRRAKLVAGLSESGSVVPIAVDPEGNLVVSGSSSSPSATEETLQEIAGNLDTNLDTPNSAIQSLVASIDDEIADLKAKVNSVDSKLAILNNLNLQATQQAILNYLNNTIGGDIDTPLSDILTAINNSSSNNGDASEATLSSLAADVDLIEGRFNTSLSNILSQVSLLSKQSVQETISNNVSDIESSVNDVLTELQSNSDGATEPTLQTVSTDLSDLRTFLGNVYGTNQILAQFFLSPGTSNPLALNGIAARSITCQYEVLNVDTSVTVRLEGSLNSSDWSNLDADNLDSVITEDGLYMFVLPKIKLGYVRFNFVSEEGGTNATVDVSILTGAA